MPISDSSRISSEAIIKFPDLVNIYGASIGARTVVGPFVEIQASVVIGQKCKISSHAFICSGVCLADEVFVGHGVMFTNDRFPRSTNSDGSMKTSGEWELVETTVDFRASIGSNSTILPGVTIGRNAIVAAGAVVTRNVAPNTIVAGSPARLVRQLNPEENS